jgi:hypothetical protein
VSGGDQNKSTSVLPELATRKAGGHNVWAVPAVKENKKRAKVLIVLLIIRVPLFRLAILNMRSINAQDLK